MTLTMSRYTKRALWGSIISLGIILIGSILLGEISGYEAKILIKNSLSGLHMICNTVALASATILALLLTLLGLSSGSSSKLKEEHYRHIIKIAKVDIAVFIASIITFLLFNLPITESDNVPQIWYQAIYYLSLAASSVISSALIMVVLMLFNTITSIIKIVGLGQTDHYLTADDTENEE